MKQSTEFKVGDTVTFKAYEKEIKAKVLAVKDNEKHLNGDTDSRVFYELEGIKEPLVSITSGHSIVESQYFVDYYPDLLKKGADSCDVPPVCTDLWGDNDWIRWIDNNGNWKHFA